VTSTDGARSRSGLLVPIALAILLPSLAHLLRGDWLLNFADEGYLWYGVQRTVAGEVPLRDFMSYHPGRYYWCAALEPLFGDGIVGVRAAGAAFQALGLLAALLVTRRVARAWGWQILFGVLLALWMFPRHKLYESSSACLVSWAAVRLLERPSAGRHLAAGVFVGLAGWFGSQLGLYAGLSLGALVAYSAWKRPEPGFARRASAWALGVGLGFAPFLAMLLFVPGFAGAVGDMVRMVMEVGTNLPRPWPWPWNVETAGRPALVALRDWMESVAFLLPVLALPGLLFAVLRARGEELAERAASLAPSVVALFFLHHASVNSGAWHLAQCVQPLLLALLALPVLFPARRALVRAAAWGGLALVTLSFTLTWNPIVSETIGERFVERRVAGETLHLPAGQARYLAAVERVALELVGEERLFLAPNMPSLYCVLGKTSPTWGIYFSYEMSHEGQERILRELDASSVRWALVADPPEGKSFRATFALVWARFESDWQRVPAPGLPPDLVLFRGS
jgi:hypothetical protein